MDGDGTTWRIQDAYEEAEDNTGNDEAVAAVEDRSDDDGDRRELMEHHRVEGEERSRIHP